MIDAPPPPEQQVPNDESAPVFSRGRISMGPNGKLDDVAKTKVDKQTMDAFRNLCARHNTDVASVLRNYIYSVIWGERYDSMILKTAHRDAQRMAVFFGEEGPIEDLSGPPK